MMARCVLDKLARLVCHAHSVHYVCSVRMQQIISTKSSKIAVRENLDPQNLALYSRSNTS